MDVNHDLYLAKTIASHADTETMESYEEHLPRYESLGFTYVPIPSADAYFDRAAEELRDIVAEQYLDSETTIAEALHRLQRQPFLLFRPSDTPAHSEGRRPDDETEQRGYRIVTVADLNRREVKSMLYTLIAELESRLARRIRRTYDSADLLSEVGEDTVDYWESARDDGLEIHVVDRMYLSEMKQVFRNSDRLVAQSAFDSGNQFQQQLRGLVDLRHTVMHPAQTLVRDQQGVERLAGRVDRIEAAIQQV